MAKRLSKKGISPLVATIILIVFSVGLGAIVMSWGETYIEQSAEFTQGISEVGVNCGAVDLDVLLVKGEPQVCYSGSELQVLLENHGEALNSIQANVIGTGGVDLNTNILGESLAKADVKKISFNYNQGSVNEILQLKLTPALGDGETKSLCTDSAVVIEDFKEC